LEVQDLKDHLGLKVNQQTKPMTERRANKECPAHKASQDQSDLLGHKDRKANQGVSFRSMAPRELPDQRERQVHSAPRELQAAMVKMALKERSAQSGTKAKQALKETPVNPEAADLKASLDQRAPATTAHLHAFHQAIKHSPGQSVFRILYTFFLILHPLHHSTHKTWPFPLLPSKS